MKRLALAALLAAACAGDDGPAPAPELRGECPAADRIGGFRVLDGPLGALADGRVLDGVVPATVYEVVEQSGPCALLRRAALFCDPPCAAGDLCGLDAVCRRYPAAVSAGLVTLDGLVAPLTLEPLPPGMSYSATGLARPPFAPAAAVTLAAPGGPLGPLELRAAGVAPLALDGDTWDLAPATPLAVRWVPPPDRSPGRAGSSPVSPSARGRAPSSQATVHAELSIDQHGISPLVLACSTEDTGALDVPAALVDALLAAGASGRPWGTLTRQTADHADTPLGCVDFVVGSSREPAVAVPGGAP